MQVRLLWEFRGPDAEQTAIHFEQHLREFFRKNHVDMPSGVARADGSLWTAFCDPPDLPRALVSSEDEPGRLEGADAPALESIADRVGRALRPNRVEIS
jgi:hypothetical protein